MSNIKPKPKFKVGDYVTYKDIKDLPNNKYQFGGRNQAGYCKQIVSYGMYLEHHQCFKITVKANSPLDYVMLEYEFKEYDIEDYVSIEYQLEEIRKIIYE